MSQEYHEVNKPFSYEGITLMAVEIPRRAGCQDCYFKHINCSYLLCTPYGRPDKKSVKFIQLL